CCCPDCSRDGCSRSDCSRRGGYCRQDCCCRDCSRRGDCHLGYCRDCSPECDSRATYSSPAWRGGCRRDWRPGDWHRDLYSRRDWPDCSLRPDSMAYESAAPTGYAVSGYAASGYDCRRTARCAAAAPSETAPSETALNGKAWIDGLPCSALNASVRRRKAPGPPEGPTQTPTLSTRVSDANLSVSS